MTDHMLCSNFTVDKKGSHKDSVSLYDSRLYIMHPGVHVFQAFLPGSPASPTGLGPFENGQMLVCGKLL